ncbi:hypothetical protein [uncultured Microbacterium sp.]|uniref:hypothetical protein n=1 Tax=uncultured Microbacterium sp. TaxID=191216 RepID=UPI0028DC7EDA|nr:hypothetical protein [uncultured Microbacterium sp.]
MHDFITLLANVPGELIATAGVIVAALLTLAGVVVGHIHSARTARRTATLTREQTSGELALDIAREGRAEIATVKAELSAVRAESDTRHAQYGLAHRHASTLHTRWPGDQVADRPTWPGELAPPL